MTEEEWLALSASPTGLLYRKPSGRGRTRLVRLCGAACCRRIGALFPSPACLGAIDVIEAVADRRALLDDLAEVRNDLQDFIRTHVPDWPPATNRDGVLTYAVNAVFQLMLDDGHAAIRSLHCCALAVAFKSLPPGQAYDQSLGVGHLLTTGQEAVAQSVILRDVLRQKYRPVTFDHAWRTPVTLSLAQAAYDERQLPSGELDAVRLSVLADALEDAGCDNADLLTHLRSPGPHVRGCWAVDLVLGKQ